ncbi:hypothetical protein SEA_BROPLEASE_48 [Streptomyces phage BroPlease]|uniref:Uncharacterized protein n=1 Tax=Streptomyces phage phiHau3 TaxID=1204524 RepID=K4HY38_9CAUD|nr:hypothetical protein phiHau3_49 [Streptomyces phage phiHau3]AFU62026.1 hypothetical protein phiHau3_49 [Streptomyces phage phiHau3]USH44633.1 hypothetical protein SEA_BROPLEASE_48 [Streptomyces phage BroPlease]USH44967.1 hypothetical protein SEA_GREENWEASEL_49 [Streptomyces phage GreenWeasel]
MVKRACRLLGRFAGPLLVATIAASIGYVLVAAYLLANP